MFKCSIGIIAYNEEKSIGGLTDSLLRAKPDNFILHEIFIISDGSTDRTDEIAIKYCGKDRRVKFIAQAKRSGKARAVNVFLKNAGGDICILSSADIAITETTVEKLCAPLIADAEIGLTGCNPVPLNDPESFLGYIIHFWWFAHNRLPRFGEMIAFRNIVEEVDSATSVDEAFIELQIRKKGLQLKHVPEAVVYNLGAKTVNDLLKQRKRINIGHAYLKKIQRYKVGSLNIAKICNLAIGYWKMSPSLEHLVWLAGGALLEIYCRIYAIISVHSLKNDHSIWEIASTTKGEVKSLGYDSV